MLLLGDESNAESMYTDMLEDICDRSQSYPTIDRREASYIIRDCFKQRQAEWKGRLLSTRNMDKGLHKLFKSVVNDISQALPILGEYVSEVCNFVPEPRNFAEVTRLSKYINKLWLKATMKEI